MGYALTGTREIAGKTLCVHCGEECQIHYGGYHRNEEDEYYCNCDGAKKEREIRNKQSKLRNEIHSLDYEANKLINANEHVLQEKMYLIELALLKKKYKKGIEN